MDDTHIWISIQVCIIMLTTTHLFMKQMIAKVENEDAR